MARYHSSGNAAPNRAFKSVTLDGSASYTLFTVTGAVRATVVARCTTNVDNEAQNMSVGIAGSTQCFIVNTLASAIDAGELWMDATPATSYASSDVLPLPCILNGTDIILTSHADIGSGVIEFICEWSPVSSGASVVAA